MKIDELVEAFFRAYNAHDVEAIRELLAEDAELIVPTNKPGVIIRGRESILRTLSRTFGGMIRDIREEILSTTAQGDRAAVEIRESGTYALPARGEAPAVSASYQIECGLFFRANRDGKIDRVRSFWDTYPWSLQVGIPIEMIHGRS